MCWIDQAHKLLKQEKFIHKGQAGGYYDDQPCIIRGGLGKGKPMINESEVWFNGDDKTEMAHETFGIRWFDKSNENGNGFCKTNRKPYDLLVCFSLLAFKHAFNDYKVFHFSSDGDNSEWEIAKELFYGISGIHIGQIFPEEELEVA